MDVAEQFRLGMRRLAAGVSVVATRHPDGPTGLLATSVSSVALEPNPCLLVCINRAASSHGALLEAGVFSVNLLARGDEALARRFSSSAAREDRFGSDLWISLTTGAPCYRDALASFDCEVMTTLPVHTHTILVGKVVAVRLHQESHDPLIYFQGSFDRSRTA